MVARDAGRIFGHAVEAIHYKHREFMELHLPQQTEAKLVELAQRTRRGTDELLEEAVGHLVAYHEWFANVR